MCRLIWSVIGTCCVLVWTGGMAMASSPQTTEPQALLPSAKDYATQQSKSATAQRLAKQTTPTPRREPKDGIRFRFGAELDFGLKGSASELGLGPGLAVRLGAQFNRFLGLYFQPRGLVGVWASGQPLAGGVFAAFHNALMLELTLPFFHIGLGPSLDIIYTATCQQSSGNVACGKGRIAHFGVSSRLALVLGKIGRGSRAGLSINVNPHLTLAPDGPIFALTVGVGVELF